MKYFSLPAGVCATNKVNSFIVYDCAKHKSCRELLCEASAGTMLCRAGCRVQWGRCSPRPRKGRSRFILRFPRDYAPAAPVSVQPPENQSLCQFLQRKHCVAEQRTTSFSVSALLPYAPLTAG